MCTVTCSEAGDKERVTVMQKNVSFAENRHNVLQTACAKKFVCSHELVATMPDNRLPYERREERVYLNDRFRIVNHGRGYRMSTPPEVVAFNEAFFHWVKRWIAWGNHISRLRDKIPFSPENMVKRLHTLFKKVQDFINAHDDQDGTERAFRMLTIGGVLTVPVEVGLKAIEKFQEGGDRSVIDAALPFMSESMYRGFKLNPSFELEVFRADWGEYVRVVCARGRMSAYEERVMAKYGGYAPYFPMRALVDRWVKFLEAGGDEAAYRQRLADNGAVAWDNDFEYDSSQENGTLDDYVYDYSDDYDSGDEWDSDSS